MQRPNPAPIERLGMTLFWLCQAVAARMGGDQLSMKLIELIIGRIRSIKQGIARIAELVRSGKYVARRSPTKPRATTTPRKPAEKSLLSVKRFGWLLPLVPDATGARSQLSYLLQEPEIAELIAAAPKPMIRQLRSLCWMLRLEPPPILAQPKRPARPRPKPATTASAPPPPAPARPVRPEVPERWKKLPGPRYPKGCA